MKYKKYLMIFISIPKGRNFLFSLLILKKIKIILLEIIYRKIILKTNRKNIFIIILKNKDLQKILNYGLTNLSIIGSDLLINNYKKIIKLKKINSYLFLNNNNIIVTKFFNLCNYYNIKKFNLKLNGVLEFFSNFKNYGLLDITETNKTLYENKLFPKKFLQKINLFIILKNLKKKIIKIINKNVKNFR
ncbi:hypothetical protein CUN91_00755 [Candidatus Carsonella ruddii]|uniref:ATP phosphoribosyltransferase n=2 Tax=Carsonella ruddii TaxID=114186 RepID=A0A2K8K8X5_CARRU|nr:hypothetical protein CUN91_00755 [Candidatus Carsonella ruddii]